MPTPPIAIQIVQALTPAPSPAPQRGDLGVDFSARMDARVTWEGVHTQELIVRDVQANAQAARNNEIAVASYQSALDAEAARSAAAASQTAATAAANSAAAIASATSTTSLVVGAGSRSLTLAAPGIALAPGMWVRIANTAAPGTNAMRGVVSSYDSGTRALVVDVRALAGSGTYTAWTISPSSELLQDDLRTVVTRMPEAQPLLMWYASASRPPARASFSRASVAWTRGPNGLWQQVAAGVVRVAHAAVTRALLGYLSEPSASNYVLHSQDLSNAAWTKTNATLTATQASPDGATTAQRLAATAAGACSVAQASASNVPMGHATVHVRARADAGSWLLLQAAISGTTVSAWFDVSTGAVGATSTSGSGLTYRTHSMEREELGYWWCELTVDNLAAQVVTYTAQVVSANSATTATIGQALVLWQHQIENTPCGTSPIVTTTAAAVRSADVLTVPLATILAGCTSLSVGVIAQPRVRFDVTTGAAPRYPYIWALGTEACALRHNGTTLTPRSGSTSSATAVVAAGSQVRYTLSAAAAGGQSIGSFAGAAPVNLSGAGIGTTATDLFIGHFAGGSQLCGYIQAIALYGYNVPASEAQALSES